MFTRDRGRFERTRVWGRREGESVLNGTTESVFGMMDTFREWMVVMVTTLCMHFLPPNCTLANG